MRSGGVILAVWFYLIMNFVAGVVGLFDASDHEKACDEWPRARISLLGFGYPLGCWLGEDL